jgi:hypothetical protein
MSLQIQQFPYHDAVLKYFQQHEKVRWGAFHDPVVASDRESRMQLQLRKSARRLQLVDALPWLYNVVNSAQLGSPVACYLAATEQQLQVAAVPLLDQPRLIFTGPVLEMLTQEEVLALVAGELARLQFWQQQGGEYLSARQLLGELVEEKQVPRSHELTFHRFQLCTDLLADQSALRSSGNAETVVSAMIKCRPLPASIGESLDAASLLEQAQSLWATADPQAMSASQRGMLLRIATLQQSVEGAGFEIAELESKVTASQNVNELDLLQQVELMNLTRQLICCMVEPAWMQTPAILSYARSYFPDLRDDELVTSSDLQLEQLATRVQQYPESMQDYFCFILLDFVSADRDLKEAPLALALRWTEHLGVTERFREITQRELRLRKMQIAEIVREREQILAGVERA